MTIKVNIREVSRGLNPSRWSWFIEVNQGGVPSMAGSGTEDDLATASKEAVKAAQEYLDATTDFRTGEKVVVADRGEERWAEVVGFGTGTVFVTFDAEPSIGAWAYNRSSIKRRRT